MPTHDSATPQFEGFSSPNGTVVPDEVFDILMPQLTEAELRVLLYIIRRTFGFKKSSDDISLRQIVEGITTKEGRVLDGGAGIGKTAAVRAIKSLAARRVIFAQRNSSPEKGNEATTYALRFKDAPLFTRGTRGGSPSEQALVPQRNTQQTVKQQTEIHLSSIRTASRQEKRNGQSIDAKATSGSDAGGGRQPSPDKETPSRDGFATGMTTLAEAIARRRRQRPEWSRPALDQHGNEQGVARAANRVSVIRPRQVPQQDEVYQVIQAYIADFSRELNDRAPLRSSTTRAYNLYKRSGLDQEAFIAQLYAARTIVKERAAAIRTQGDDNAAGFPVKHRAGYWFAVLEDLLGLRAAKAGDEHSPGTAAGSEAGPVRPGRTG
jgi:Bacteriophage replication protein O